MKAKSRLHTVSAFVCYSALMLASTMPQGAFAQPVQNPGIQIVGAAVNAHCLQIVDRYHVQDSGGACTAGTPGGSNTQIQYNNAGAFGGVAGFIWNGALLSLPATAAGLTGLLKGNGATAITAAANGTDYTLITANTCGAGNHVSAITAAGIITCTADSGGSAVSSVFTRTGAVVAASGDYSVAQVTGAAPLASPTFTGTPAAPTPAANVATTQLATAAMLQAVHGCTIFVGVGDGTTDDTAALQSAINTAGAVGANNCVDIPPPATVGACYKITSINATTGPTGPAAHANLTIRGHGKVSCLKVAGQDASGNWLDLSGSVRVTLKDLYILTDGSTIPKNVIFWAWLGTTYLSGLVFDHVDMDVNFSHSGVTAFGFTGGASLAAEGNSAQNAGGLSIRNSNWYGRYAVGNAPQSNPALRSSLLRITSTNALSDTSANQTIGGSGLAWSIDIQNSNFVDAPSTFNTGDNRRAALICEQCGAAFTMMNGSIQCLCDAPAVMWTNVENIVMTGTRIGPSNQDTVTMNYAIRFGSCTCGEITLTNIFGTGKANSGFIGIDNPGSAGAMPIGNFKLLTPDVGGNTTVMMTVTGLSCTLGNTPTAGWMGTGSHVDLFGLNVVWCGAVDFTTIVTKPGTITNSNPGTQQTGCKFRLSGFACDATN